MSGSRSACGCVTCLATVSPRLPGIWSSAGVVNDYLRGRQVLKRTFVLIDSRHGIKPVDGEIMDMLDGAAVSYQLVLTKIDKIKASDLKAVFAGTAEQARKRPAAHPGLIATSSETGRGVDELRTAMLGAVVA